jgi:diguanylate cyclase (GGDEF)-like protein
MTATLSFALRAHRQADEVHLLAFYDPLTGLANRALLCKRIDEALKQLDSPAQQPAVAAFDVHHLSKINDTYGRRIGDLLLQQVAARLKHHTENDQRVGYLGGGTFVLVEPELVSSEESIVSLLESTVFAEPFVVEGRTLRVTFRSGVAHYPEDGTEADALVQKAEAALRHAKDTGEQYFHYAIDLHSQVARRIGLENRLQAALDEQQFELYYQPQIAVQSGRIESVEALLRWNDPERGFVAPAEFLPVLEASAMIVSVGNWVLARALSDCRRWAEQGLGPVRVAVNVSPLQIRRRNFVPLVVDLLRLNLAGRPGYGLDLEITETAVLQDLEGASRKLQELRDIGVRVALDDFGTGYSSLGLLSKLPVDLLKIDRSFVAGLPDDDASAALVRSIVQLASAFKLVTVAEGVETASQMNLLRQMRCQQTQGFLHCHPVPAAELERVLKNPSEIRR